MLNVRGGPSPRNPDPHKRGLTPNVKGRLAVADPRCRGAATSRGAAV
jgi:hypothetical protein